MPTTSHSAHRPDFSTILDEAHAAANATALAVLATRGDHAACGFAWVTIGGNEPLARYCRQQCGDERRFGSKDYPTGWHWFQPANVAAQSVEVHEAAANAFRDVLARHGISATVSSRLD